MTYEINLCKAVKNHLAHSNCDINNMNNLCYEIATAYGKVYGSDVNNKLRSQCANMISEKKKELGYTDCYMRRPVPPPIFNQVPHFFPQLLAETNDPDKAYKRCCELANNSRHPITSHEYCKLDADALVIPHKTPKPEPKPSSKQYFTTEEYNHNKEHRHRHRHKVNYEKYAKKHPVSFYIGYTIVIIMILFLVYIFILSLYTN
jgi:hypothetical protein